MTFHFQCSQKSSNCSKFRYREVSPSDVDYDQFHDTIKQYETSEDKISDTKTSTLSIASNSALLESSEESVKLNSLSDRKKNEQMENIKRKTEKNTINIQRVELDKPSKTEQFEPYFKLDERREKKVPKVIQVESKNIKYKMILNSEKMKSLKSLEDLKKYVASQRKSMVSPTLNITNIINKIRINKNLQNDGDNNKAWFEYLDNAGLEVLRPIADVLMQDKDVCITVLTKEQTTSGQKQYFTVCRLNVKDSITTFRSLESSQDDAERKVYVDLLKYLTSEILKNT